jgi:hypothetical protein
MKIIGIDLSGPRNFADAVLSVLKNAGMMIVGRLKV